ncbi:hypothetical protein K461DRAFT_273515 [Myriangium duriaei CBS 260.36]|uniref:Uncharacterized protein n=1 Tax=Myriangium duriaei CBS 260.36 TaxID=1168546 RepID=A0A9P4JEG2_9PEZI|nr:hypothetical protein K461DRAFT_273515 [Myriangium duriaei CBS 260.36]
MDRDQKSLREIQTRFCLPLPAACLFRPSSCEANCSHTCSYGVQSRSQKYYYSHIRATSTGPCDHVCGAQSVHFPAPRPFLVLYCLALLPTVAAPVFDLPQSRLSSCGSVKVYSFRT